jgi:hypothetical protein
MRRQFDVAEMLSAGGIKDPKRALGVAHINQPGLRIAPHIIGIVNRAKTVDRIVRSAVKQFEAAIVAISDADLIHFR